VKINIKKPKGTKAEQVAKVGEELRRKAKTEGMDITKEYGMTLCDPKLVRETEHSVTYEIIAEQVDKGG